MKGAIRSRKTVLLTGTRPACLTFNDGRITEVREFDSVPADVPLTDAGEHYLLPGLVDTHVHVNEPGRTEWEGFRTATRAAAAGGYTCLIDMPLNSVPTTTNVRALEQKREAATGQCLIDYAFWGGAVQGNEHEIPSLAAAGVRGFKSFLVHPGIDEFTMVSEADLRAAMPAIARTGLPLLVHAELPEPVQNAEAMLSKENADWRCYRTYLRSRPAESEIEAIRLMIRLCREYDCPVHIVHLSSAEALPLLIEARSEGLPLTVETCPHYLCLAAEEVPDRATEYKCAPPIRSAHNQERLWEALASGLIDLIATDHSPCPPALKAPESGDFSKAWGGIASLSVSLKAIWTAASQRGFDMNSVARWMASEPAQLAGLAYTKGELSPGFDADFVVFDGEAESTLTVEQLHFRHPVTPYLGRQLRGRVVQTLVRGETVFRDGAFVDPPMGRECPQVVAGVIAGSITAVE